MTKHTDMHLRPKSLTIEALKHGGFVVSDFGDPFGNKHGGHAAAFTCLSDAVAWIDIQMKLPEPTLATAGQKLHQCPRA